MSSHGVRPARDGATGLELAIYDVIDEMQAQDRKWGQQNHEPAVWLAILTEEVGELAQATLADRFGAADHSSHSGSMRDEAVQIAAVALQFISFLERRHVPAEGGA